MFAFLSSRAFFFLFLVVMSEGIHFLYRFPILTYVHISFYFFIEEANSDYRHNFGKIKEVGGKKEKSEAKKKREKKMR